MRVYKRLLSAFLSLSATSAGADPFEPEPAEITAALRANYLRAASKAEVAKALAGIAYPADFRARSFPVYVLQDGRAIEMVGELGGADSRYFIVPPRIKRRDFGDGHSVFLTPTGGCLQGECGVCAPTASSRNRSDQWPNSCQPWRGDIPAAPPAPPRY